MKDKPQDDIHNATPLRLAEMLEDTANEYRLKAKYSFPIDKSFYYKKAELLDEAARRLRELQKPTYHDQR